MTLSTSYSFPPSIVALKDRALLKVSGEDATTFLQGQLTQDMTGWAPGEVRRAAYCSPKGRVLASFDSWKNSDSHFLSLPQELAETIQQRLQRFVLRARVTLQHTPIEPQGFGIVGDLVQGSCRGLPPLPPPGTWVSDGELEWIRLGHGRLLVMGEPAAVDRQRSKLLEGLPAVSEDHWTRQLCLEGVPDITLSSSDAWIPQMLNADALGAISFKKGCYTGQEIVARTHYLGAVKRRTQGFVSQQPIAVGQPLYRGGEKVGEVVNATREAPFLLLAVVSLDSNPTLSVSSSLDGPELECLTLPYDWSA